MKKRFLSTLLIVVLLFTSVPAFAAEKPIMYTDTITVTKDGGRYQVGFINVEFKKNFIDESKLPATFDVQVYAENGEFYVEFAPDVPNFFKKVHIRVDKYNGLLFDKVTGENIYIDIKTQQVLARHFSRYRFF